MRSKGRVLLAVTILVFALGAMTWPRSGQLEMYTSRVIRIGSKSCRIQMLVPRGWEVDPPRTFPATDGPSELDLSVTPRPRFAFAPRWLRRLLVGEDEEVAQIDVCFCASTAQNGASELDEFDVPAAMPARSWMAAHLNLATPVGKVYMEYARSNKKRFEATYRHIMNSVRVLP